MCARANSLESVSGIRTAFSEMQLLVCSLLIGELEYENNMKIETKMRASRESGYSHSHFGHSYSVAWIGSCGSAKPFTATRVDEPPLLIL